MAISIDLSASSINANSPEYQSFSRHIQGNILKPHGRAHASLLCFKFQPGREVAAKTFVRDLAVGNVSVGITSAERQDTDSKAWRADRVDRLFIGFYLSATGYDYLGETKPRPTPVPNSNRELLDFFALGMKGDRALATINDPAIGNWEPPFQADIHGMLLVAHSDRIALDQEVEGILAQLRPVAEFSFVEKGDGRKNENGNWIEHFGYVDGISQPRFFNEDFEDPTKLDPGRNHWNPAMPAELVLVKDPGSPHPDAFGSFLVFRKLEQNVHNFKKSVEELANSLQIPEGLAGALMVGRFENGVPVTLSSDDLSTTTAIHRPQMFGQMNNFDYSMDALGAKCPFHAHIRKMNPRGGTTKFANVTFDSERRHMIARRGISYDERSAVNPAENGALGSDPQTGVGLLFMCFQSNIANQFAFMQEIWANNKHFINFDVGLDPLIGQGNKKGPHKYARKYGDPLSAQFFEPKLSDFVAMKGGEYFFAPSMDFLKNIGLPSSSAFTTTALQPRATGTIND